MILLNLIDILFFVITFSVILYCLMGVYGIFNMLSHRDNWNLEFEANMYDARLWLSVFFYSPIRMIYKAFNR